MSDQTEFFSSDQITDRALLNALGLCLASTGFAKEQGLSPAALWASIGRQFAPGWEGMEGTPLVEALQEIALNMVSVGGTLLSLTGDDKMAKAVFGNWPAADFLAAYELTQAEADAVWGVFEPIVDSLGLQYHWQRAGDQIKVTLNRPD